MSEIKGTLLGIVLAISVFTIVFGIITLAVRQTSNTVKSRLGDAAEVEPEVFEASSTSYSLTY